jgi:RNA-directed DNA polymerase
MDDFVFWAGTREETKRIARRACNFLTGQLALTATEPYQINQSRRGITVCGFRVLPGVIRAASRRRRRYLGTYAEIGIISKMPRPGLCRLGFSG